MRFAILAFVLLAGCGSVVAEATLVSKFIWTDDDPKFGGISGIEVSADGTTFAAINDRGFLRRGRILRDGPVISGITDLTSQRLLRSNGRKVTGSFDDAEGIAISDDGTTYISFEGGARVLAYPDVDAPATFLPQHPDFATLQPNSALEALAVGPDGAVYTMPERSGRADRPFPVYILRDGVWDVAFSMPRRGPYLPVGMDIGPDGLIYVLERDFTGIGFRSRIRQFDTAGDAERVILETRNGTFDNLEGISVWRDDLGDIRITMVSDDNFQFFQQTQIVEYVLTP